MEENGMEWMDRLDGDRLDNMDNMEIMSRRDRMDRTGKRVRAGRMVRTSRPPDATILKGGWLVGWARYACLLAGGDDRIRRTIQDKRGTGTGWERDGNGMGYGSIGREFAMVGDIRYF